MTSSSKIIATIEPWSVRSAFSAESWLSEAFARDTETLTKALQKSFFSHDDNNINNSVSKALTATETPTGSNISGPEPATLPKRHRTTVPGPNPGKVTKRKPRASKKTHTTFISADPANFRQMVQQITGVRLGSTTPVLKPEPRRPGAGGGSRSSLVLNGEYLPATLDTSAFLLEHHHQQQQQMGPGDCGIVGSDDFDFQAALVCDGASTSGGLDLDPLANRFPTLESWKAM